MNKKGFTVVELMATFILVSAASLLLVRLALTVKEIYTVNDLKTVLLVKQGNMVDIIYKDINNKTLNSITSCGKNCVKFTYSDTSKQLKIDSDKKIVKYGNYTYKLTDSNYLGNITYDNYSSSGRNIFYLDIPIYDRLVGGNYGINLVFNTNVDIPELTFDTPSKKVNLVTNGDLFLKNNNNFTAFGKYENGYIKKTSSTNYIASTDEFIKIDPSKSYEISLDIKSSNNNANYYFGFIEYDIDYNPIGNNYLYYNDTLAYLTQDINVGDTVIHLSNTTNFNTKPANDYQKGFILWNYKNSRNEIYLNPLYINNRDGKEFLAYSRNVYTNIFKTNDSGNLIISNNTIELKNAWKGPKINKETTYQVINSQNNTKETVTTKTYLSQANAGAVFNYSVMSNKIVGTNWNNYKSDTITGVITNGKGSATKFRNGTVYIKPAIYANLNNTPNTTTYIRNVVFKEI